MSEPTPQEIDAPQAPETTPVTPEAPKAPEGNDPWTDPEKARAEIERLRRENGAARTNAKATAAEEARNALAQEIGKALGIVKDNEPADPAKLTEQLSAQTATAKQAQLELSVYRAASEAGADANALLDSRTFINKVSGIDPTDSAAVTAAITEAVAANSALASRKMPVNPAQGSSAAGVPPEPSLDEQIAEAQKAGKARLVMQLQNRKLAELAK